MDEAGIDAVLATDDTQSGRKSALTAKAARPTAEAKQQAWASTVESDELANESVTAVVMGFRRVQDPTLIAGYVETYFAMLNDVWEKRSNEIANRLIQGYFPGEHADASVLEKADAWLAANEKAPYGLRRPILEGRDSVARQLRVQQADVQS